MAQACRTEFAEMIRRQRAGRPSALFNLTAVTAARARYYGLDLKNLPRDPGVWLETKEPVALRICMEEIEAAIAGGRAENTAVARSHSVDLLFMFWLYGKATQKSEQPNVLYPSRGLLERLLLTELRGVRTSDVQAPFPAFYVVLPKGLLTAIDETGDHDVEVLGIGEMLFAQDELDEETTKGMGPPYRLWNIYAGGGRGSNARTEVDDSFCNRRLLLFGDAPLAEVRQTQLLHRAEMGQSARSDDDAYWDRLIRAKGISLRDRRPTNGSVLGQPVDENTFEETVLRLVVNLALYVASPDVEISKRGVPSRLLDLKKQARCVTRERTLVRLREKIIRLPDEIAWDLGASEVPLDTKQGWSLAYRTMVRGHWRQQPCGPGRTLRRLLWIKAHARGPEGGALAHDYRLQ